jgi:hypothetical protein
VASATAREQRAGSWVRVIVRVFIIQTATDVDGGPRFTDEQDVGAGAGTTIRIAPISNAEIHFVIKLHEVRFVLLVAAKTWSGQTTTGVL